MTNMPILKQIALFIVIFSSILSVSMAFGSDWSYVKYVNDGDTIVLKDGRKIRYIGINAPEISHDGNKSELMGNESRAFNVTLVNNKKIRLEFDQERTDKYGRILAYIFLEDGTFVNKKLIQNGFAYVLYKKPNLKYNKEFLASQLIAMTAGKGIWNTISNISANFIGNKKSKRFHATTCSYGQKTGKSNVIIFRNKWNAFKAGFAPCKKCPEGSAQ